MATIHWCSIIYDNAEQVCSISGYLFNSPPIYINLQIQKKESDKMTDTTNLLINIDRESSDFMLVKDAGRRVGVQKYEHRGRLTIEEFRNIMNRILPKYRPEKVYMDRSGFVVEFYQWLVQYIEVIPIDFSRWEI